MEETLAFQIIALYRDFLSYTTEELKKLGVSFGQMPLLLYTGKHPGCAQAELTKALKLDWGYSQRSITKLVDTGFIQKTYDESKASNCLVLTELGKQAFLVCHEVFQSWDQLKTDKVRPEEKTMLTALLKKIAAERKDNH